MSGQPQQSYTFFTGLATTFPLSLAHSDEPQVTPPPLKHIQEVDALLCRPRRTTVALKRPRSETNSTHVASLLRVSALLHGASESVPFFLQVGSAIAIATPVGFDRMAVRYSGGENREGDDGGEVPCEVILALVPEFVLRSDFIPRVSLTLPSQFSSSKVVVELQDENTDPIWRMVPAARPDLAVAPRHLWQLPQSTMLVDFGSQAYLDLVCRREICRMLTRASSVPAGSDRDFGGDVDCAVLRGKFPCLSFLRTDALQKHVLDNAVTRVGEFVSQCADGALRVRAACFGGLFSVGGFLRPADHCRLIECESSFLQSCCLTADGCRLDWPFPRAQGLLEQLSRRFLACQLFERSAVVSRQLHDVMLYVVRTRAIIRGRSTPSHQRFQDEVYEALLRLLAADALARPDESSTVAEDLNRLCHYLSLTQGPGGSHRGGTLHQATKALKRYLRGEAVNLEAMSRQLPPAHERSDSVLLLQGLFDSPPLPHEDASALSHASGEGFTQSSRPRALVRRSRRTGLFEVTFDADKIQTAWNAVATNIVTPSATSAPVCSTCRSVLHAAQRECPRFLIETLRLHQCTSLPRTFNASSTAAAEHLGDALDDADGVLMTNEEAKHRTKQPAPRQPANEYVENAMAVLSAYRRANERRAARSKLHVWETVCYDVLQGLRLDKDVVTKLFVATLDRAPALDSRTSWERYLLDEFPSEQSVHFKGTALEEYRERVQQAIRSREQEIVQHWGSS